MFNNDFWLFNILIKTIDSSKKIQQTPLDII